MRCSSVRGRVGTRKGILVAVLFWYLIKKKYLVGEGRFIN